MKKFFNIVFLTLVFVTTFIAVFPKDKLYFLLQKKLLAYNVVLESEAIKSKPFNLEVKNTHILLSGARIASIRNLDISLCGVELQNIRALGSFQNSVPSVKTADIFLSLPEFAHVNGNFGSVIGSIDIANKKLAITAKITPSVKNQYKMIFNQFQSKGDSYVYELSF